MPLPLVRFISLSLAIPSGNYYKSESQSIFNPRGMALGSDGVAGGRAGAAAAFSGDRREGVAAEGEGG